VDLGPAGVPLEDRTVKTYDPWSDTWRTAAAEGPTLLLPGFKRSLVIRIEPPR